MNPYFSIQKTTLDRDANPTIQQSYTPKVLRHRSWSRFYRMTKRGESGVEPGVPGKTDGEPPLEYSNECECDNGGVW